jgi:hypothetical protein
LDSLEQSICKFVKIINHWHVEQKSLLGYDKQ